MSSNQDEPLLRWYLYKDNRASGPFVSGEIRKRLTLEQLEMDDLISLDKENWQPIRQVPEVMPLELRAAEGDPEAIQILQQREQASDSFYQNRSATSRGKPIAVMLLSMLLVIGVIIWLWEPVEPIEADCSAVPSPGVIWRYCQKSGLNAEGSDLSNADLNSVILKASNLSAATLSGTTLVYADLRGADLSYAILVGSNLKGANLTDAKMEYANLESADLSHADLTGANLGQANIANVRLDNAIWIDGRRCAPGSVGICRFTQ